MQPSHSIPLCQACSLNHRSGIVFTALDSAAATVETNEAND